MLLSILVAKNTNFSMINYSNLNRNIYANPVHKSHSNTVSSVCTIRRLASQHNRCFDIVYLLHPFSVLCKHCSFHALIWLFCQSWTNTCELSSDGIFEKTINTRPKLRFILKRWNIYCHAFLLQTIHILHFCTFKHRLISTSIVKQSKEMSRCRTRHALNTLLVKNLVSTAPD